MCAARHLGVTAVTKMFCGDPRIARAYLDAGIAAVGDARVANLQRLGDLPAQKWLLRPPMRGEIASLVECADVSLNSELSTIRLIAAAARQAGREHQIILMADLGDIREGYTDHAELLDVAQQVEDLAGVRLLGIGTNLTCFSFVLPDEEKMQQLADLADLVAERIGRPIEVVSGGNSATLELMLRGGICAGVNNLRLGESLLFGRERAGYQYLPGTRNDAFILACEIVELKEKPSQAWGRAGKNSYGESPVWTDRGPRLRAVCALGRQDFDQETCWPVDPGAELLGASSDHLIVDLTDSERSYAVGDVVELRLGYFAAMRAFTSDYVEKCYVE